MNRNFLISVQWVQSFVLGLCVSVLSLAVVLQPVFAQNVDNSEKTNMIISFFRALKLDDEHLVQSLLKSGLNPNVQTEEGFPAISFAMQNGSNRTVRLLLQLDQLNVNQADLNGVTPLMVAASQNNASWVASLLSKGAKTKETGSWTEVHYAAAAGSVNSLRLLLSAGAVIDAQSPNGTTPLMLAVRENQLKSVELLLEYGADLSVVNRSGFDAAGYARMKNNPQIINLIQKKLLQLEFEKNNPSAAA